MTDNVAIPGVHTVVDQSVTTAKPVPKPALDAPDDSTTLCRESDDLLRAERGAPFRAIAAPISAASPALEADAPAEPLVATNGAIESHPDATEAAPDVESGILGLVPASVDLVPSMPGESATEDTMSANGHVDDRTAGIGIAAAVSSFVASSEQQEPTTTGATATLPVDDAVPTLNVIMTPPPSVPPTPPSYNALMPAPAPNEPPASSDELEEGGSMTIIEHLEELRRRLFVSAIGIVVGAIVGWFFVPAILDYLQNYAPGVTFISTTVLGPLALKIKLAFLLGLVFSSPVVLYEIWAYVAPGLTRQERRYVLPFSLLGSVLFAGGAATGLFVIPLALRFLLIFFPELHLGEFIDINGYVMFIALIAIIFGITFELPIFMVGFSLLGITNSRFFIQRFKIAVFIMYGVAMVITPGVDFISPLVLGTILVALYWVGILLIRLIRR